MPYVLSPDGQYISQVFGTSTTSSSTYDPVTGEVNTTTMVATYPIVPLPIDFITFQDSAGNSLTFQDFLGDRAGLFYQLKDRYGNLTTASYTTITGSPDIDRISEVRRNNGGASPNQWESYLYDYRTSGEMRGEMTKVTLRRGTDGTNWTPIRQVVFSYYGSSDTQGLARNLKKAEIMDGAGTTLLATRYYRYHKSSSLGFDGALKYVFEPDSYARLTAQFGSNVDSLTDAQVDDFADYYFEYDYDHRVSAEVVQAKGSSTAPQSGVPAGMGRFTFDYYKNPNAATTPDHNKWEMRTTETLPDHTASVVSRNIVYTNGYGEVMLKVYENGPSASPSRWMTYYKRDSKGNVEWKAYPSAVSTFNEAKLDLLDYVDTTIGYRHLRDNTGVIVENTFLGGQYLYGVSLKRGEMGVTDGSTRMRQFDVTYASHSFDGVSVHPVASIKQYRDGVTTSGVGTFNYSYTWLSNGTTETNQIESITATSPIISAAQHGPGGTDNDTRKITFDKFGRPIWAMDGTTSDPNRVIDYYRWDIKTGAPTRKIADVKTDQTGDFSPDTVPSGWTTAAGYGLHRKEEMEVDELGREKRHKVTTLLDADGLLTYTIYKDVPNFEMRVYAGWNQSAGAPTGPTWVYRQSRTTNPNYEEVLTMSAAPHVGGDSRPTGTEDIANVESLSRTFTSAGGQVNQDDVYYSLNTSSYSTTPTISGASRYVWLYDYESRGRLARTQLPTNTVYARTYNGMGRPVSDSVGTTSVSPAVVRQYEYDGGGIGDGNLTKVTDLPGDGTADRVSQFYFDWRNRLITTKNGVQASETDDVQRPVLYYEHNNLNELTSVELYDGDTLTDAQLKQDSDGNGVPDRPTQSRRRARAMTDFDDQGRAYDVHTYTVNQSDGSIPASDNRLTTGFWFDRRGNTIKTSEPGGLVSKSVWDGPRPRDQGIRHRRLQGVGYGRLDRCGFGRRRLCPRASRDDVRCQR
jgi:hypothetical protein